MPAAQILQTTRTLTNDEIIHLPTTPIEIIAAPGAGKGLLFIRAIIIVDTTAGAYGGFDAISWIVMGYSGGGENTSFVVDDSGTSRLDLTNFIGGTGVKFVSVVPWFDFLSTLGPLSPPANVSLNFENTNIQVQAFNGSNFTGGNAANVMKVTVWYGVIDV